MKARVIVTLDCPRNCENCCNKEEEVFSQHKVIYSTEELLKADLIMITGGEPMLIPDKVHKFVRALRYQGYKKKIYLYTALYTPDLYFAYKTLLQEVDGIQFTLHDKATTEEVANLKLLSETDLLRPHASNRLSIDRNLYEDYDFSNIDFSRWSSVRKLLWKKNCPLPADEKLFIYEI